MQCFTTGHPFVIHWWNYTFLKTGQNIVSPVSTGETDEKVPALNHKLLNVVNGALLAFELELNRAKLSPTTIGWELLTDRAPE